MTDTTKTTGEYLVHDSQKVWLLEKLAKLNRKAVKLGTQAIEITFTGEKLVPYEVRDPESGEYTQLVNRYLIATVTGTTPRVAGWTFTATLQHSSEAGVVIRTVPGYEGKIPLEYRTASRFVCDHCQKVRNRRDTYLLRDDAGTFKQVGANCLGDFLGGQDPHRAAELAEFALNLHETLDSAHEGQGGGSSRDRRVYLLGFLQVVAAVIRVEERWTSRGAAKAYNEKVPEGGKTLRATADCASAYLFATGKERRYVEQWKPCQDDQTFAEAALAWTKETFHAKDPEARSDFEHNLVVATSGESIDVRSMGIAAACVGMYKRHLDGETERKARAEVGKNSQHFGEVGQRLIFSAKLLFTPKALESQFGTTYLHKLITPEGNLVTWFASNILADADGEDLLKPGAEEFTTLIGTVKKHDSFRDEKQTVVNRVAVPTQKQIDKATGADKVKKAQAKAAKKVATRFEQLSDCDW